MNECARAQSTPKMEIVTRSCWADASLLALPHGKANLGNLPVEQSAVAGPALACTLRATFPGTSSGRKRALVETLSVPSTSAMSP